MSSPHDSVISTISVISTSSTRIRRTTAGLVALAAVVTATAGCRSILTGSVLPGSPVSAGCGFGTDAHDVATTIHCSGDAIARQDAEEVCALQTASGRAESAQILAASGPRTCVAGTERAFKVLNSGPGNRAKLEQVASQLRVSDVHVNGASASATVDDGTETQVASLRVENGGWRLEHSFVRAS